jgi:hypothetical protein
MDLLNPAREVSNRMKYFAAHPESDEMVPDCDKI